MSHITRHIKLIRGVQFVSNKRRGKRGVSSSSVSMQVLRLSEDRISSMTYSCLFMTWMSLGDRVGTASRSKRTLEFS